jgi:isopentenyl-diphosphate delta-isomerase
MAEEEVVDLVDDHDRVVGEATVAECLEKGLLHRAVAVLVIRSDGRLVLQQRSRRDAWHPGLWTISCTGHVKKAEGYEAAAERELFEELGVSAELARSKKYLLPPMSSGALTEREWVCFFIARSDSPLTIDLGELEAAKEVSEQQLRRMMDESSLTPDAVILLTEHLRRRAVRH